MATRGKRLVVPLAVVVVVMIGGIAIATVAVRSDAVAQAVAQRLSAALGRQLRIHGGLIVELGMPLQVRMRDVTLANARWADDEQMAWAAEIKLTIDAAALILGRVVLADVDVVQPWLLLERSAEGEANWVFLTGGEGRKPPVDGLETFHITGGELALRNVAGVDELRASVEDATGGPDERGRFSLEANGRLEQSPYTIRMHHRSEAAGFHARVEVAHLDLRPFFEGDPQAASDALLPDADLHLGPLREMQGVLEIESDRVQFPGVVLEDVQGRAAVEANALVAEALQFRLGGGRVRTKTLLLAAGSEEAASAEAVAEGQLEASAEGVAFDWVLEQLGADVNVGGSVDFELSLAGKGQSIADLIGSADGSASVVIQEGRLDEALVRLATQNLLEILGGAITGDEGTVPLRCLVAEFEITNGLMKARTLIIDTADAKIIGGGTMDLAEERVDLEFLPRNKDFTLISGQAPIQVSGTFGDLSVGVDAGLLAASLATPVDLGITEDADCTELVEAALERSG